MKRTITGNWNMDFANRSVTSTLLLGFLLLLALPAGAATLYVNANTGNDATTKAANSPSSPWRTIGRAAWGSANREAPNASQAAAAGDTVLVAGGTYTTSEAINNRWSVVYNPANNGTVELPITFTCVGSCVLGAPNANAPVIGAYDRNYIKWYADISQGHVWRISVYARQSGSATATQVNTAPDTGPVVGHGATGVWIEGADIDGGLQTDYTDNYNGIRFENCTSCRARNNTIRNFRNERDSNNGTAVTLYGSPNTILEHNLFANAGSGVNFKDTQYTLPQSGIHVRNNRIDNVGQCFGWSVTAENRNYVYQNVCTNARLGLMITGGGLSNDWIVNNTFVGHEAGAAYLATNSGGGGRFWNNIVINAGQVITMDAFTMPSDGVIDFEHNLYSGFSRYYSGPDGSLTFDLFKSVYSMHDRAAPASVDVDPRFANPAGGDYRLCVAGGQPVASCTGPSPALQLAVDVLDLNRNGSTTDLVAAGAYVLNNEQIGPGASTTSGVPPLPPSNLTID